MSLTLIVQAHHAMAAGRYRDAGRLVLEAADEIRTPEDADQVAELAEVCMGQCGFVQRGRFESALELVEERRAELVSTFVEHSVQI